MDQQPAEFLATILVVDDDPGLRKLVTQVLTEQHYRILTASDGKSALSTARKHEGEIQLLITDVMMPRLDGFDLRERILQERGRMQTLVISGALDPEITGEDFPILRKPFRPEELVEKVREVLAAPVRSGGI